LIAGTDGRADIQDLVDACRGPGRLLNLDSTLDAEDLGANLTKGDCSEKQDYRKEDRNSAHVSLSFSEYLQISRPGGDLPFAVVTPKPDKQ
jgi:hypothetical protein